MMLRPLTEAWGKDLKECRMCPVIDLGRRRVWRGKRREGVVNGVQHLELGKAGGTAGRGKIWEIQTTTSRHG